METVVYKLLEYIFINYIFGNVYSLNKNVEKNHTYYIGCALIRYLDRMVWSHNIISD